MTKKIKVIIVFVLAIIIVVESSTLYSASSGGLIKVGSASGEIGEIIEVPVFLQANPGIVSMSLKIEYDEKYLSLADVKDEGVLGVQAHKPEYKSPYTLAWYNDTATSNYTVTGKIATLYFVVKETAFVGNKYSVNVSYDYDNYDVYDKDLNLISFAIENGGITVTKTIKNTYVFISEQLCENTDDFIETPYGYKKEVIYSYNGGVSFCGTGTVAELYNPLNELSEKYTVIVNGDLNGDSVCDVLDASLAERMFSGKIESEENAVYAANGEVSDEIDVVDYQSVVNLALAE